MKTPHLALLVSLCLSAAGAEPFALRQDDVVVFVGGADMVRLPKEGRLEAALISRFLAERPRFRDLAWDRDTVYFHGTVGERWRREAFGGWPEQLQRVGATVVIAQFGKIESLKGAARLGAFREAYGKLLDQLAADGRRVMLIAPGAFEWAVVDASALADYTRAAKAIDGERGLPWIEGSSRMPPPGCRRSNRNGKASPH